MTELEQVTKERNLVLARMHAAPKENTGAWWRRECPDWCDACKLVELNKQVERLVREDGWLTKQDLAKLGIAEPAPPAPPAAPKCPYCEDKEHWYSAELASRLGWVHSPKDRNEYSWAPCQLSGPSVSNTKYWRFRAESLATGLGRIMEFATLCRDACGAEQDKTLKAAFAWIEESARKLLLEKK